MLQRTFLVLALPLMAISQPTTADSIITHDYERQSVVEQFINHERDFDLRAIFSSLDELLNSHPLDKEYQEIKSLHREWKLKNHYNDWMAGDIATTDEFLEAARLQLLRLGEWLYVQPTTGRYVWPAPEYEGSGDLHLLVDDNLAQFEISTVCKTVTDSAHGCNLGGHLRIKPGWMPGERIAVLSTKYGLIVMSECPPNLGIRGGIFSVDWCGVAAVLDGYYEIVNDDEKAVVTAIKRQQWTNDEKLLTEQSPEWKTLMVQGLDGIPEATVQLWSWYETQTELTYEPYRYWLYRAAMANNPEALYKFGQIAFDFDPEKGKAIWQRAADEGYLMAKEALQKASTESAE